MSSDPHVTLEAVSTGDTSSCTFTATIDWGDKTAKTVQSYPGGGNGSVDATFVHDYSGRGTFTISWSIALDTGSCGVTSGTLQFTLTKIEGTLRLAALGDSYSSGEGAGNYYAGTNSAHGCHRSPHAWALQMSKYVANHDVTMPSQEYFLACSGAVSSSLKTSFKGQKPQIDALQHVLPKPELVTLTMGGNDLGFPDVVKDCYEAPLKGSNCIKDGTLAKVEAKLPSEQKTLASDYIDVHLADPGATLLIVGYPQIFEDTSHCGAITTEEEKALNVLTGKVDAMIARAAAADKFSYVSVLGALAGHEMCTEHPWLYEIGFLRGLFDDQQQAHPNALGQEAIAKIVATFINTHL